MAIRQFADVVEDSVAQRGQTRLEFLVACDDVSILRTMAEAVRGVHGRLICTTTMTAARGCIACRKVDGIVLDMRMDGAAELIHAIRHGHANTFSVIFGCMGASAGPVVMAGAGANFVLRHPLAPQKIVQTFHSAVSRMTAERRRYVRYPVVAPVMVSLKGVESRATMSNLSAGGMRIWSLEAHRPGATMRFSFELPGAGAICGSGEVTRTSPEGLVGVKFGLLAEGSYQRLLQWIDQRESTAA